MDGLILSTALSKRNQNKEKLLTTATEQPVKKDNSSSMGSIISLLIGIIAIYLSWNCNSNCFPSMTVIEKSVRAFFAFLFGWVYIIIYLIAWSAQCGGCGVKKIN